MNENINSDAPQQTSMNSMMIIGAIVVLGIIVFLVMRSTSAQPNQDQVSISGTSEAGSPPVNDTPDTEMTLEGDNAKMTADRTAETGTTMEAATDPTTSTQVMEGDTLVVSMDAGSFFYKPNEIKVKKGQKVRIEMTSVDMMHDFNIDELKVKMPIVKSGDTGTVEFVADTVGEFEFYCSVGQHRANGQVGTLIVE